MRITVLGAAGSVGRRVVTEAVDRGHHVTAVVRDAARFGLLHPAAEARVGDASDQAAVAVLASGQDLVISATRPAAGSEGELAVVARALVTGLAGSGVRLLVVGGAGNLTVPGAGHTVMDAIDFPAGWRPIALTCDEQLAAVRAGRDVDWAYLSPAAILEPGTRTGAYRLGRDELLVGPDGISSISIEDLAVALLDEAENPRHHGLRFTVGY